MSKTPIAIQLFAVRGEVAKSLPETLAQVAKLGFKGAEPWGYDGKELKWQGHPVADVRKMYDDNGLTCCGIHLTTDAMRGDNFKRTIELNRVLGNRFLVIAADKPRMSSREGIAELASILNDACSALKGEGMFAGYHDHGFDFTQVDGKIAWDILFASTEPEVIMQMDIGNCAQGGGDPLATLRRFPGRARSVHLKDFGGEKNTIIGEGKMDFARALEICQNLHRPEWYVIEQGGDGGNGFDIPGRSLKAVEALGY